MRIAIGALALLVTVASVTGCDTRQPLQIDSQTVDVTISAPNALVPRYDTWVVFEDRNGNGMSDDDYDGDGDTDEFLWCEVPPSGRTGSASSVPWPFSVEISVIRAGSTALERVTSAAAISGNGNLASYDGASLSAGFKPAIDLTHPRGVCSENTAIPCDPTNPATIACSANGAGVCHQRGTCSDDPMTLCDPNDPMSMACAASCIADTGTDTRRFVFADGRRLSAANFEVLNSTTNPLYELNPETGCPAGDNGVCITSGVDAGTCSGNPSVTCDPTKSPRCPGVDFGPALLDGGPMPYSLEIGDGDTVIVRARRLEAIPGGFTPLTEPDLSSGFLVDGQIVNVEGSTSLSSSDPASSIDFFFTSR